jgi:hypothetical protein
VRVERAKKQATEGEGRERRSKRRRVREERKKRARARAHRFEPQLQHVPPDPAMTIGDEREREQGKKRCGGGGRGERGVMGGMGVRGGGGNVSP